MMKVISPSFKVVTELNREEILRKIELAGRISHKSEEKITEDSASKFVKHLLKIGHESVLEHVNLSVIIVCDRGVSHELVRHRLASYTQESTRYCDYTKKGEIVVIKPVFLTEGTEKYRVWKTTMELIEKSYFHLRELGLKPEEARAVLPNSLKTEIFVTANIREWRHIFELRCNAAAHSQMREIMIPILELFQQKLSPLFDDFSVDLEKNTAIRASF